MTAHEFVIGEPAAIYIHDYGSGRVEKVTVERDTKLYWIANGRKFRKDTGKEPGSDSNWGRAKYLLPLDDSRVLEAMTAARKSQAFGRLAQAQNDLARDRENPAAIQAVRDALDKYEQALDNR